MTAPTCPWCGHPTCDGDTPSQPHHGLCCTDGPRRPCWGPPSGLRLLDAVPDTY